MADDDWLKPQDALEAVKAAGASAPEAWHLIATALLDGRTRCHAASVRLASAGVCYSDRSDVNFASGGWRVTGVPAPGHPFWLNGDVNYRLERGGRSTEEDHVVDEFWGDTGVGETHVRGVRFDRAGIELIIYERAQREPGQLRATGDDESTPSVSAIQPDTRSRRGRTPGSGSYLPADAALLVEMRELIADHKAMSPHGAAMLVADRASGNSSVASKTTRLAKSFRRLERMRAK